MCAAPTRERGALARLRRGRNGALPWGLQGPLHTLLATLLPCPRQAGPAEHDQVGVLGLGVDPPTFQAAGLCTSACLIQLKMTDPRPVRELKLDLPPGPLHGVAGMNDVPAPTRGSKDNTYMGWHSSKYLPTPPLLPPTPGYSS